MTQSHTHSLLEAVANTAVGFAVSVLAVQTLFPLIGVRMTMAENLAATSIMTVVSILRSYALRRAFNWLHMRRAG